MDDTPVSTVQEVYSGVEYLITDIPAAVAKFATDTSMETSDEEEMEDMDDMGDMDEDAETPTDTGATALTNTPAMLTALRNSIVNASSRYLSTGTILARTDNGVVMDERPGYDSMGDPDPAVDPNPLATCEDRSATGPAKCVFSPDSLREEMTTFHLGSGSATDENRVSFRTFRADREPVMFYRDVFMSQVRTIPSQNVDLREVYEDSDGNEYLLTSENITNMELTDETGLPTNVTLDTAPDFADLFAVYEDDDENRYLLTPDNVMNMELTDETGLPTGVTLDTAVDFASLSKVREDHEGGREEYVGYDGMLRYSMFFVGVHRFFDEEDELTAVRFEHASIGRIYDEDAIESGIQSPSVELTGEGVMVGMERQKSTLDSHLVQGDVNIMYDPAIAADNTVDPVIVARDAMVDISITNIQRLVGEDPAWYANPASEVLNWNVPVMNSKFEYYDATPTTQLSAGSLRGSFYGTEDDPEVGGVFHHEGIQHEIIGSFGSKLDPVPDDDDDMMGQ